jgi:diguanylate cyclase (GGDEF)-like protein
MSLTTTAESDNSRELRVFHDVAKALTSSLDLETVLQTILKKMAAYFESADWSLLMVDDVTGELHRALAVGESHEYANVLRLETGEALEQWALERAEPLIIADVMQDARIRPSSVPASFAPGCSIVCMPVRTGGKTLGIIELMNFDIETYSRNQMVLQTLTDYAAIAIENARAVRRIQEISITDDCTGLYNARHLSTVLSDEVHRSARFGYELAVLFLDLDFFKRVNDEHGHLTGSRLLGQVGQFLRENLRLVDAAFRYGGDEFVILLPQTSRDGALFVARRLVRAFHAKEWRPADGIRLKLTVSVGIATYPLDAGSPKEIVQHSDEMMYRAKQSGRDRIAVFGRGIVDLDDAGE